MRRVLYRPDVSGHY